MLRLMRMYPLEYSSLLDRRIDIYEKISQEKPLGEEEQLAWNQTLDRWKKIIEKAAELEVPVMVDAEESWIQPAIMIL